MTGPSAPPPPAPPGPTGPGRPPTPQITGLSPLKASSVRPTDISRPYTAEAGLYGYYTGAPFGVGAAR